MSGGARESTEKTGRGRGEKARGESFMSKLYQQGGAAERSSAGFSGAVLERELRNGMLLLSLKGTGKGPSKKKSRIYISQENSTKDLSRGGRDSRFMKGSHVLLLGGGGASSRS